jgi:hypothetical protein
LRFSCLPGAVAVPATTPYNPLARPQLTDLLHALGRIRFGVDAAGKTIDTDLAFANRARFCFAGLPKFNEQTFTVFAASGIDFHQASA